MAQGGPIPGPAVRNTPADANDYGLVVRVVGGGGVGVIVDQGTSPWIVSDPPLEAAINVALSTRASEATLAALNAIVTASLDVALSTRLADATFTARINTLGQKLMAASTPVVIASDQSTIPISAASLPLPAGAATEATLATRATEATLATRLADATFTSRINTLGQKLMAASTPVVIASDQSPVSVTLASGTSTGTLNNGVETTVGVAATQIIAANAGRKSLIIQNTGTTNMRVGAAGVTVSTGVRLASGDTLILELPVATNAIFAIRETTDTTALTQEIT